MDENENETVLPTAATIIGVAVVGAVCYAFTLRKERAKRKKIQEWEQMNLDATAAFRARLTALATDSNASASDFWKAWHEETAFMKLINDQPMY